MIIMQIQHREETALAMINSFIQNIWLKIFTNSHKLRDWFLVKCMDKLTDKQVEEGK